MSRGRALPLVSTAAFLLLAPGTAAALIPWALTEWRAEPAFLGLEATRWLGAVLIIAGAPMLLDSFARFALEGLGTPAPIYPTERLIVSGLYRYVRNPMYVGVIAVIFGEALLMADIKVLIYGAIFWLLTHLFVLFYEEPTLRRRYGARYDAYCAAVRRWLPRLTPWQELR
jgi:protein-S-isoprenylcysteine O-methyltransferase Ste14